MPKSKPSGPKSEDQLAKKLSSGDGKRENRYSDLLADIFAKHYRSGMTSLKFMREEIGTSATKLGIVLPKNLGDLIYSFRFRTKLPHSISDKAAKGFEWVIELAGRAKYRMIQRKVIGLTQLPDLGLARYFRFGYVSGHESAPRQ